MTRFSYTLGQRRYAFDDLTALMARASSPKSGDQLAGIAAGSDEERVAARYALADLPLSSFLDEALIPYEDDEVTRLILDGHDSNAFADIAAFTVGELRDWLLSYETCLLYTSDAADERSSVDLGGRRIIKKKNDSMLVCDRKHYVATPSIDVSPHRHNKA